MGAQKGKEKGKEKGIGKGIGKCNVAEFDNYRDVVVLRLSHRKPCLLHHLVSHDSRRGSSLSMLIACQEERGEYKSSQTL